MANLKLVFAFLGAIATCLSLSPHTHADVNESPMGVRIVEAFQKFEAPRNEDNPMFRPVIITHAGDQSNRLFLASQQGIIYVIPNRDDVSKAKTFLNIADIVHYFEKQNEEGLLGFAFHPDYKTNGHFFVYYTSKDEEKTSVVSRFTVSKNDPNKANPDSEMEILRIAQPFWNHNGGSIEFGPDGYLYIGLGDGGAANDPQMNGQNLQTWLGSILRIDINSKSNGKNYAIPEDNPFVKFAEQRLVRPEIYAYGLRNVWRLSFDDKTKLLYAADVGQNVWEEINIIVKGGNYGWNLREGQHSFGVVNHPPREGLIEPIWEYHHDIGKSITGGQVYRGTKVPQLDGYYLYADYVSGRIWALKYNPETGKVEENRTIETEAGRSYPIVTFGRDEQGEVYCSDYFGNIFRFELAK